VAASSRESNAAARARTLRRIEPLLVQDLEQAT